MDKKKSTAKSEWIKCQSKSNPGRCYMFNKTTGETTWCETRADAAAKGKTTSPLEEVNKELSVVVKPRPTWTYAKPANTPAQDRLKRLQAKLKSSKQKGEEKNNNTNKNGKADKNDRQREKATTEQLQTKEDYRPTTTGSKAQAKPAQTKTNTTNGIVKKSKMKGKQKSRPAATPLTKREVVIKVPKDATIEGFGQDTKEERPNTWNYGNAIVSKITEICKNTFKNATKVLEEGTKRVAKQSFKIPKKASNTATNNPLAVQLATSGSLNTPAYVTGNANSRLEQLRQSLQQEQKASGQAASHLCADLNEMNSMQRITSTNTENASEPMDWQPNDESLAENTKVLTVYTNNYPTSNSSSLMVQNSKTMGEYYDMVNENLLRLSAEKQRNSKSVQHKWLEDHYYFVVDTNVLLQHVTFIDDLSKMKLCDTNGSILYIPYMVLQELDKLKMRGVTESAKTLAARAIKYLNAQLEASNQHFQAQSALEERKHLITVTSPDDSIINCCLQVKQHVENIILLTEDINLRNKALCNNLLVSTKSDLVSMHPKSIINRTITINTTTITSTISSSKTPVPAIK